MQITLKKALKPIDKGLIGEIELEQCRIQKNGYKTKKQGEGLQFKKCSRIFVITSLFGIFLTYRIFFERSVKKNCILDHVHESTFGINRWLNANEAIPFIGLGQIIMDILVCSSTLYWMLFLKNFRFPVTMAMFQYGRSLMLRITTMPFASYVVWFNPGFPSFSVFYDHTSDYFFSGHTGTLMILILESNRLKFPMWVQGTLILCTIYIILMLLIGRVHYTVDIFGGLVYSWYFYSIVDKSLGFFDQIMNSPYMLVDTVKEKVKQRLLQTIDQGTSLYDIQHD